MGNIPVWMKQTERGIYLACIGHFFPKEERRGQIILLENTPEGPRRKELFSRLPRPCHIDVTDFNADGKPDLLCTVVHDFNGDFHPDIALLTGQETEILGIYYSDRKGGFEPLHTIFQRPPTHGHTCMEGADFNQDGRLDLLVCNGDNGDYESPAKPYHGIRILLNRDGKQFDEAVFLPMHGVFRAIARDFDEDGDGDLDIVLGSLIRMPSAAPAFVKDIWERVGPSVLILKNTLRKSKP